ncbi:hypothetical protein VTJ49DRAFT_6913 [Mycothermus thermophilus]|uniref:Lysine-specific metallo-endopeptidase domain-containing protein n=1 Tax=Humicola insolens TaxID=85995 RepID=A0ABR3V0S6_HUMIN
MESRVPLLRVLVLLAAFLFVPSVAAIPWQTYTCAGKTYKGKTIEDIYNNALEMAERARERVYAVRHANFAKFLKPDEPFACMANNIKWLWGTKPHAHLKTLTSADKDALDTVIANYDKAINMLKSGNVVLYCDSEAWDWLETLSFMLGAWTHRVSSTEQYIRLKDAGQMLPIGEERKPICSDNMLGSTSSGHREVTNEAGMVVDRQTVHTIILCLGLHTRQPATLSADYTPAVSSRFGNPDDYGSAAGTLLHEIFHTLGEGYDDKVIHGNFAYRYSNAVSLAQTRQADALYNPDNYRIFAEMSMAHSKTRWGAA